MAERILSASLLEELFSISVDHDVQTFLAHAYAAANSACRNRVLHVMPFRVDWSDREVLGLAAFYDDTGVPIESGHKAWKAIRQAIMREAAAQVSLPGRQIEVRMAQYRGARCMIVEADVEQYAAV